jgi:alkyl sulfatase BDS1-like metallo-beta-lactamase superfamily hydrolase
MKILKILCITAICMTLVSWSFLPDKDKDTKPVEKTAPPRSPALNPAREFEKSIVKISGRVYSAVGYGLANSVMIEGDDGLIIVDVLESVQAAQSVLTDFRKISAKPVKAVIYTHNHVDHVMGAAAFMGDGRPEIYAHASTDGLVQDLLFRFMPIIGPRSIRMFGNRLGSEELIHSGIGSGLKVNPDAAPGYRRPTRTFTDTMDITVSGVRMKLIHAPGETNDQIYVWLADMKTLISADNYYTSFPNAYTIRGTTYRDMEKWYRSIDIVRDLRPENLVPCHGRPLSGADDIYGIMTNYRDAIQYVHDQGIRAINQGMTADEMAESIKLPPHLSSLPYLQEFYGRVSWSLRSLFDGNIGWFSGDSADLQPLSRKTRARMMADLAGGADKLLAFAKKNAEAGNSQAALELTGHLLQLDPSNRDVRALRTKVLSDLGKREKTNVNARHYFLTEALELADGRPVAVPTKITPEQLSQFPIDSFMAMLPLNLKASESLDTVKTVGIRFPDEKKDFTLIIRRGVAEIRKGLPEDADILVTANAQDFKEMVAKIKNPASTLFGFTYDKGSSMAFGNVLKLFQLPAQKLACFPVDNL